MNLKAAPETPKMGANNENPPINDLSVIRNGERCAGVHLIVDVYGAKGLGSSKLIKETLLRCVEVADATLLHLHLHDFEIFRWNFRRRRVGRKPHLNSYLARA